MRYNEYIMADKKKLKKVTSKYYAKKVSNALSKIILNKDLRKADADFAKALHGKTVKNTSDT